MPWLTVQVKYGMNLILITLFYVHDVVAKYGVSIYETDYVWTKMHLYGSTHEFIMFVHE